MTAPFDWTELAYHTSYIYRHEDQYAAAAYIRERIEAAFVPVEQRDKAEALLYQRTNEYFEATARAEAAEAEVKRLDHSTTHTCWDECPRLACAQRREIEALTAQLARARQEGWNAAIEAAASAVAGYAYPSAQVRALAMPDPVRGTLGDSDGDDGA